MTIRMLALLSALVLWLPVRVAADPLEDARSTVQSFADEAVRILNAGETHEGSASFLGLFENSFDVPGQARLALGAYWDGATTKQRSEFTRHFKRYVVRSYESSIRFHGRDGIVIVGTRAAGTMLFIVDSEVRPPGREATPIRWFVRQAADRLRIIDVAADNISMLALQRAEMASLLMRNGGVTGMIATLADREGAEPQRGP